MNTGRKISGGKYKANRKKKKYELAGVPRKVHLKVKKTKLMKVRGTGVKEVLLACDIANILDSKGKAKKAKIINVVETKANRFWARENRLIKGAIIDTELGKARITNRPGQEGSINAILIE
jgi:small subunit ribosomal protein S8e